MATNRFFHISLTENDVPGVKLAYSLIEKHSNVQLRRWLYCRDLKTSGNKDELVKSNCNTFSQAQHVNIKKYECLRCCPLLGLFSVLRS